MAELATPSAANISTADDSLANKVVKPERPDEELYKSELAAAEKALRASEDQMKAVKAKIDNSRPNNKDSPSTKRQQELRAELGQIRTTQQAGKSSRTQIMDKVKRLDENLKSRINEQKTARSKTQFKSVDEVQQQIDRLQKSVDAGNMKIVDEKKALADISQLNRQKKGFAGFDDAQKGIDEVKSQISELRKTLDDPESKALSERYTKITTELDTIKAEQDTAYKGLNALRDERTKIHEDQQKKYTAVKDIKDKYYSTRRAAYEYEKEARRIRDEKRKAENDAYHRGRRQEVAKAKLDEAGGEAYYAEIRTAQSLLTHFDPSSVTKAEVAGPGKFAAAASRTIDDSGMKGTRLAKKGDEEENYFMGGGGKKSKRTRNKVGGVSSPATPSEGRFNLDLGTIEGLAKINVDPPMSQSDVPSVVEKLKEKLAFWKGDQDRKTKENIAKAQAEIDKLEAEATAADAKPSSAEETRKPAAKSQTVNGDAAPQEDKPTTEELVEGIANANIEDDIAEGKI